MTTKSTDKWLPALLLAAIVHVIVFAVLYINYTNKNQAIEAKTNSAVTHPPLTDTTRQPTALVSESEITEIPVNNEAGSTAVNPPAVAAEHHANTAVDAGTTQPANQARSAVSESSPSATDSNAPQVVIAENAANPYEDTTSGAPLDNPLTTQRRHAALLDMDIPTQGSNGKSAVDKKYDEVKADTEDLNAKLSSNINEIKNRTQKKIEEAQAIQAYAHAVDNGRPSVALSSKPAANPPATENAATPSTTPPSNRLTTPAPAEE